MLGGWLTVTRNLFAPFMVLIETIIVMLDSKYGLAVPAKTGDLVAVKCVYKKLLGKQAVRSLLLLTSTRVVVFYKT